VLIVSIIGVLRNPPLQSEEFPFKSFGVKYRGRAKARHKASYERTAYSGVMPIIGVP